MHLDTICTLVDVDQMVVYPNLADSLIAYTVRPTGEVNARGDLVLEVSQAEPFLVAAAKAMEIDTLHHIDTGLDPVTAEREQWDDGNNTLALAPRLVVAYERNDETNARLEEAGIEVVRIAGSELGSGRGGPVPAQAEEDREVGEGDRCGQGRDELHVPGARQDRADHRALVHEPEQPHRGHRGQAGHRIGPSEDGVRVPERVAAQHVELAVGKVDDAADPENQGQAGRHQEQGRGPGQSIQELDED